MRVLQISDVYFPRINGVSTSIETFRRDLFEHGIESLLIAPAYPNSETFEGIQRMPSRYLPVDPEDRVMSRSALRKLTQSLKPGDFDLIHVQTPFMAHYAGLAMAGRLGVPCIATYHTFFEEYLYHYLPWLPKGWLKAAARSFSRRQCNELDAVIVPSSAMARTLAEYGVVRPMHILPTGIPLESWQAVDGAGFRRRLGIAPDRPVALYVGRVAHEKNIDFLIRVMQRLRQTLPDALLLIAGEGPALANLKRLTARLDLLHQVRFIGYLDRHDELPACYCAANAFVFASRTETQGLVLLEAMALNLPVVALAAMGTADILQHCDAALVPDDNEASFAAQLAELLRHPSLAQKLACRGRPWAERWDSRSMALRLAGLYRQIQAGEG